MQQRKLRFIEEFRVAITGAHAQAAEMVIAPGDAEGGPKNSHEGADQWLFVLAGSGTAYVEGKRIALRQHSLLLIERGEQHEIRCTGDVPLQTLNFYVPPAYAKNGERLARGKSGSDSDSDDETQDSS